MFSPNSATPEHFHPQLDRLSSRQSSKDNVNHFLRRYIKPIKPILAERSDYPMLMPISATTGYDVAETLILDAERVSPTAKLPFQT
jgi:hypothetical protein